MRFCPVYHPEGIPVKFPFSNPPGLDLSIATEVLKFGILYKVSIFDGSNTYSFEASVSSTLGEKSNSCDFFQQQGIVIVKTMPIFDPFRQGSYPELIQPVFRFDFSSGDITILFYNFQNKIIFGPEIFSQKISAPVSSAGNIFQGPIAQEQVSQRQKQQVQPVIYDSDSWSTESGQSQRQDELRKKRVPEGFKCSKCETMSTPEARRGPNGPKTLCNKCGLRWSKSGEPNSLNF